MFLNFFFKTVLLLLIQKINCAHHKIFKRIVFTHTNLKISNVKYAYACHAEKCQKITEFSVSNNISSSCYDRHFAINFQIVLNNNSKSETYGYLPEDKGLSISNNQLHENYCKTIKK